MRGGLPKNPIVLLDADVLCHQMAYASTVSIDWDGDGNRAEVYRPEYLKARINSYIVDLKHALKASEIIVCLSARDGNWRKELWPPYKATRRPKPELWEVAREYIEKGGVELPIVVMSRLEGDDVIGLLHTGPYRGRSIMVSIDKDMRTVPGYLYLAHKPDLGVIAISEQDADRYHMQQTLSGDPTDEYKGANGVGEKTASDLLDNTQLHAFYNDGKTSYQRRLWLIVKSAFEGRGQEADEALMNARLARILRNGDYNQSTNKIKLWSPPCQ